MIGHGTDAPLLHGQGAEKDIDGLAVLILADVVEDHRMGRNLPPLDGRVEDGGPRHLAHLPTERGTERLWHLGCRKQSRHPGHGISIPSPRIAERPQLLPLDLDMLSHASHGVFLLAARTNALIPAPL